MDGLSLTTLFDYEPMFEFCVLKNDDSRIVSFGPLLCQLSAAERKKRNFPQTWQFVLFLLMCNQALLISIIYAENV